MSNKIYKLDSKRSVNHNKLVKIVRYYDKMHCYACCKVISTNNSIHVKVSNLKLV